ncbi:MAG: GrpB family protein [Candidatus Hermodarchaeota archaeon]
MVRKIEVVPHDPNWKNKFNLEARVIKSIFNQEIIAIYHIGSTAIPQASAKPIIDILVEVHDIDRIDNYNFKMIEQGYIPKGESGIPRRRLFIKGSEEFRTFHVHIFQKGNPEIKRLLNFRNYMIAHPKEAQKYSRLKENLVREFSEDISGYIDGKDEFVKNIDKKAKNWRLKLK